MTQSSVYFDFRPDADWTEDTRNHVLRIQLPGFQREEFRVQLDKSGKITVRGRRAVGPGTYARVDQSFPLPQDCDASKISGKFEEGSIYLVIQKKVPAMEAPPKEAPPIMPPKEKNIQSEDKEKEQLPQRDAKPRGAETKTPLEEEMIPKNNEREKEEGKEFPKSYEREEEQNKEKSKSLEKKEEKPYPTEKSKSLGKMEEKSDLEKSKSFEKKEEKPYPMEKPKSFEKKEKKPYPEEKSRGEDGEEETQKYKPKIAELEEEKHNEKIEKKEDAEPTSVEKPLSNRNMEDKRNDNTTIDHDNAAPEKGHTSRVSWKERMKDEMDDWLDFGMMDDAWKAIGRNKKLIAVAVFAFSAGFYVSHKLKAKA